MAEKFVGVARVSEIPDRKCKRVTIDGEEIAVWHVDGKFYAISNVCSHQHFSSLHKGLLQGTTVTCPMHGWRYSLVTGVAIVGSGKVKTFETRVEGDAVLLKMTE